MHPQFLKLLVCPLTKCPLQYEAETQELISPGAHLAYPVRDGIPVLIPDEARVLEVKSAPESIEDSFME